MEGEKDGGVYSGNPLHRGRKKNFPSIKRCPYLRGGLVLKRLLGHNNVAEECPYIRGSC